MGYPAILKRTFANNQQPPPLCAQSGRSLSPLSSMQMGAYNWVEYEDYCPACAMCITIHAQIHLASSYDGDESGRFFDRTYRPGDRMAWWSKGDPRFDGWRDDRGDLVTASEECLAECPDCSAVLVAVIEVSNFVIDKAVETKRCCGSSR